MQVKIPTPFLVPITQLRRNPKNVKHHSKEQVHDISELMKMVGFKDPIVIDFDFTVWAGHGRLEAAELLEMTEVPCIRLDDLTEDQKKVFMLMDNKVNESAWVRENIQLIFDDTPAINFEPFQMKFDGFNMPFKSDIDEVPVKPIDTDIVPGDCFQLGDHLLICGDSTKVDLLSGRKFTISLTSPPYNVGKNTLGGNQHRVKSKYLNDMDKNQNWLDLVSQVTSICISHCEYSFFNVQQLSGNKTDFIEYLYKFKDHFVDEIIWFKGHGQPAMAKNVLNSRFEHVVIFNPQVNPSRAIKTDKFHGTISNVYEGRGNDHNDYSEYHAATFPAHLALFIISAFSKAGDTVLDPFAGTGTTLIACEDLKRSCVAIEKNPLYAEIIRQRWEKFTGKKAEKLAEIPKIMPEEIVS